MPRDPLDLLRRFGANATSFQLLEPGITHWFSESLEAFVGYADTGKAWVVLGEPICAPDDLDAVAVEFREAAQAAGRRVRYFALERKTSDETLRTHPIGEQPEWAPGAWSAALARKRSLREQLRRARAKGVVVREIAAGEDRDALEVLAAEWVGTRSMATMHFAVRLDLFHHASEHRYFVASIDGETVAALVAVPIYAREGWLIEDLMRGPSTPNGTSELLVDAAMVALEKSGAQIISMGLAPLSAIESRPLKLIRATTSWLFDWRGLRAFKAKLGPTRWQPVYAAWPKRERGIVAMLDILRCFAGGGLLSFTVKTAVHRYRAVLWLLAILLVPWVAALSSGGADRFFPSEDVRLAWIAFDVSLFAGLVSLASSYRRGVAQLLATAAGADVCLGIWQLVAWNAEIATGFDWVAIAVALVAPAIACIFLLKLLSCEQSAPLRTEVADPVAT